MLIQISDELFVPSNNIALVTIAKAPKGPKDPEQLYYLEITLKSNNKVPYSKAGTRASIEQLIRTIATRMMEE